MRRVLGDSLVVSLLLSLGCSTSSGGSTPGNGAAGNASGSGATNNGGAGYHPSTATGGSNQPTTNGTAPPNTDAGCAGDVAQAQLTQVNILFLLDKSGSMGYQNNATAGTWDNCAERWNPVVDTLNQFFTQPDSGRIYASLSFLPADGDNTTICNPTSYSSGSTASLKVPLTLLNATGRLKFQAFLCDCANGTAPSSNTCIVPAGGTPTRPALQGTMDYASTIAGKYPGSITVIVLITDGDPSFYCAGSAPGGVCNSCDDLTNGCSTSGTNCTDQQTEIDKITAIIQAFSGTSGSNPNSVYIVGVGADLSSSSAFEDWSNASGNQGIDLRNLSGSDAATKLMNSLQAIRKTSLKCNFSVPVPNGGSQVDASKTFVYYSSTATGKGQYINQTSDGTANTCKTTEYDFYTASGRSLRISWPGRQRCDFSGSC